MSVVIFYSLMGNNKRMANEFANENEVKAIEFSPGSKLRVFQFFGGRKKLKKKALKLDEKIKNYSEINLFGPIWARKPAPAVLALLNNLDLTNKTIRINFTYTENYGITEELVRDIVSSSNGKLEQISFINISDKKIYDV